MCDDNKRIKDITPSWEDCMESVASNFLYWIEEEDLGIAQAEVALRNEIHEAISKKVMELRLTLTEDFDHKYSAYLTDE